MTRSDGLARQSESLGRLAEVARLRAWVDRELGDAVYEARRREVSLREIGAVVGISKDRVRLIEKMRAQL